MFKELLKHVKIQIANIFFAAAKEGCMVKQKDTFSFHYSRAGNRFINTDITSYAQKCLLNYFMVCSSTVCF